jgi:site-specific DNA recombinase
MLALGLDEEGRRGPLTVRLSHSPTKARVSSAAYEHLAGAAGLHEAPAESSLAHVEDHHGLPCVIYAAKSTEDRRGSIPDQLRECRAAIEASGMRRVLAEYTDEAVSAYTRDRGQGLLDAMQHAEDLAHEFETAELWAQHSDRLARGDGRSARHVVEIGLWALKRDIGVRTVQDPDTFRDLLYAVVTGQRNHEDSRRKSLSVAAGHRRAVERGGHIGPRPDGYRVAVEVDQAGTITKRLEIDPDRQPMIELIFRLALRGKRIGAIARVLDDAGWRTNPNRRGSSPRSWTCQGVYNVLRNPRYAGLTAIKGEIVGQGNWPAYITERQHHRLRKRLSQRRQPKRFRPLEAYLFVRLARCDYCGGSMQVHTGRERKDGTFARRYVCASHNRDRSADACQAPRIDADMVEAMFVAAMPLLFSDDVPPAAPAEFPESGSEEPWSTSDERERVIDAVHAGDGQKIDRALELLLARMTPNTTLTRQLAATSRRARQVEVIEQFEVWARTGIVKRTRESRRETARLNGLLRNWLSGVALAQDPRSLSIVAHHRSSAMQTARQVSISVSRSEWRRFSPVARRTSQPHIFWSATDIVGAFQRWADAHGHAPRSSDWALGSFEHPNADTVRRHFTSWRRALAAAGLSPVNPRAVRVWQDAEIIEALRAWTARHGKPPRGHEWLRGTPLRPCKTTVYNHFDSWPAGLTAAGIET